MPFVKVKITRYVDLAFPGWVECSMVDANENEHVFVEKVPMVTAAYLDETSLPQPGVIACIVVGRKQRHDGSQLLIIDTQAPWGIESASGKTQFDVLAKQVCEHAGEDSTG